MHRRNKHSLGKKASIKSLKRYCYEVWSELIRIRDGGKCMFCGATKYLQAHHIITRDYAPTRFESNCGILLCSGCHSFRTLSAHVSPWFLYEWLQKNRPEQYDWFVENRERVKVPEKMELTVEYYRNKLQELIKELERISPETLLKSKYCRLSDEKEYEICLDYTNNLLSRRDIALKHNIGQQVVVGILKRHKVEMRKPGTRNGVFMRQKIYD